VENTITKSPKKDVQVLLDVFNAKVGSKEQESAIVGKYGFHKESNDNVLRLIGLASALNVVICSTTFPHKNIHLTAWRSPNAKQLIKFIMF
jgi:hypothetical protein